MDWFLYDNGLRHERVKDVRMWGCRSSDSKVWFMNMVRDFDKYLKMKIFLRKYWKKIKE